MKAVGLGFHTLTLASLMLLYLQVIRKGEVSCCWICTTCKDNEYVQDEFTCKACELGWWPDEELEGRKNKKQFLSALKTSFPHSF